MKINEITDKFKVMQSSPQGIELTSQNGTTIKLPPEQANSITPDPQNPKSSILNLNTPAGAPAPAQGQQQPATPGQPAPAQGQQATMGQPAQGQPQLPQVGSEVELSDNTMGAPVQAETFNDKDLIKSGKNKDIGGPNGGDKTDDFIDDVVDKRWEKNTGRSNRNIMKSEPIRESEELIAMLTIAGLR